MVGTLVGYTFWTEALTPQLLGELVVDDWKLSLSLEMAPSHTPTSDWLCGV